MMKNNREDYASYHEWLEALKKDKLWLAQLGRLQSPNCDMQAMYAEALGLFDKDNTRRYWTIYQHDIESTLEEAWADVDITPSMLRFGAIGMLTMEWLKEHGLGEDKGESFTLPKALREGKVVDKLEWLKRKGLLDDRYKPVPGKVQVNQLGAIADKISTLCKIKNKWSDFGKLWGIKSNTLRSSFYQYNPNSDNNKDFEKNILKYIN